MRRRLRRLWGWFTGGDTARPSRPRAVRLRSDIRGLKQHQQRILRELDLLLEARAGRVHD